MIELLNLLGQHGGLVAIFVGLPYVAMGYALISLWRDRLKKEEQLFKLLEQKFESEARLTIALNNLKEVIQARMGRHE